MSYDDYDFNLVHLALDLASLGEGTLSLAEVLHRQRPMLEEHGYPVSDDPGTRALFTRLGRRLAGVLGQLSEDGFYDALAALLSAQACKPYLTRHDGVPHLHYARDGAPLAQWLPAMAVPGLVLFACRHGRSRLRRCAAAGCGRWLLDTSRNQSRRYCEHACASRTTVAAHRARQKAARQKAAS